MTPDPAPGEGWSRDLACPADPLTALRLMGINEMERWGRVGK